ncbi:N-acetyltransferase [Staphylococcus sp. NRL 16/872]|uniref:N-acetyltransferase n=1 Tax=Staphylococcus sp. NRL 16/872 TaxID=2930131 RepID=UPI001FB517E9|nr:MULTISPECIES: N-acetyltransferase [unclassified Staphylococcus]MCJ1656573.1 N-acetyltransferase [Staphylococcus sp. NRL 21/187]MCJ1662328.1 N-acetyltransferase [Staphylococcus sp. NRL 18/288]MCJ1668412.1 N-acetyltransferase [Staphylococcus sp. NRL 19/737]WEN68623.1 N-acetyltransferase [Staphylococcus sp. NRL 16/872]
MSEVKHLEINYKTDELFEAFREFGNKDLYMVEELKGQMIDASSESPFYGIFNGENLAARMALLNKGDVEESYFPEYDDYLLLWKLEVLEKYQNRGYANELIEFAKSFKTPIKAIARQDSKQFFINFGFEDVNAKNPEGHDVLVWSPEVK